MDMAKKKDEIESGCLSRCDDNEPVFVLRAHDKMAPAVVRIWAEMATLFGVEPEKVLEALKIGRQMSDWQRGHGCKLPD
jgi:hypothetical protein